MSLKSNAILKLGAVWLAAPLLLLSIRVQGGPASSNELTLRRDWTVARFEGRSAPPFSFNYAGVASTDLLKGWDSSRASRVIDSNRTERTLVCTDPKTGLAVRLMAVEHRDFPTVEWTLYIKNTGTNDTPILSDIRALDLDLDAPAGDRVLHYARGAVCSMDDFQPLTEPLKPGARVHLQAGGGRSSSDFLPFFNVETPSRGGVIVGLGWSGEWAAEFTQSESQRTRLRAGMALTHLKLHPGEEIRSPRVALLFYEGDWIRGQNLWRRFVLAHHRPKVNGQPPPARGLPALASGEIAYGAEPFALPVFNGNWGGTRAADHLANIQAIAQHDLPVEFYWIDAEWFGDGPWFLNPGDWRVKQALYPDGFKPISDALHRAGRKLLLWFEPERVCEGTPWDRELSRWLLTLPVERRVYRWEKQTFPDWVKSESLRNQIKENDRLFNLAIPEARQFLTDFISARITEFGLDCYRHDANIAPLEFWRAADAPDRQGLTEIRWVEGLYAFWDELLRRHPHLLIDNCASGGRRIDLETLARSTPFWRTDFAGNLTAKQCHTYGLSLWVPLNSTGGVTPGRDSDYAWRSTISSTVAFNLFGNGDAAQAKAPPDDFPFQKAKATLQQYRALQPCFLGDYYPLTPYSQAVDVWLGWQFHRDDLAAGLVQVFRREKSLYEAARFKLSGLEPGARYLVTNLDTPDTKREFAGAELLEKGLPVALTEQPSAAVFTYRRTD